MVRRSPKRASTASKPLSAVEALMLELEGVGPAELERLSLADGLPPGQAPEMNVHRGYRMDRSGAALGKTAPPAEPRAQNYDWALVHKPARDEVAATLPEDQARAHGDAMRDAGIRNGDILELDLDMEPEDGDIVIAHVEGVGRVLRRLRIIGGVHVLTAASRGTPAIPVDDPSQVTYHGVVVQSPER